MYSLHTAMPPAQELLPSFSVTLGWQHDLIAELQLIIKHMKHYQRIHPNQLTVTEWMLIVLECPAYVNSNFIPIKASGQP